jgi:hypothetical protein
MMQAATHSLWYAAGLRWIADVFDGAADRLERITPVEPGMHEYHFDSDVYLAQVRDKAMRHYY